MPIFPSNEAVARMSGLRGHQAVWNDQLLLGGSCRSAHVRVDGKERRTTGNQRPRCRQAMERHGTYLANDLTGLRVPADSPVIFSTGQEHIWVVLAPRNGEDAFIVTCQDLRDGIAWKRLSGAGGGIRCSEVKNPTFSGALEFLKSQTMMMGDVSSSEEVMSLVDCRRRCKSINTQVSTKPIRSEGILTVLGCQQTSLIPLLPPTASLHHLPPYPSQLLRRTPD